MKKFILSSICISLLATACLRTRSEVREEESRKNLQEQMVVQQKKAQEPAANEELDSQMRELNGRVDTLQNQIAQLGAGQAGKVEDETKHKDELDSRLRLYEDALKKIEMQMASLEQEVKTLKASAAAPMVASAAKGGESSYQQAEEAFSNKDWKQAIVAYQKYRDENPKGKAYASATYKIGIAFQELKMKDEAKSFLEEVITKFPKSKEAKRAEFRLKNL